MVENDNVAAAHVSYVEVATSHHVRNLFQIETLEEKISIGYNSDGKSGHFIKMDDVDGDQIFKESELPEKALTEKVNVVIVETSNAQYTSEEA